MSKENSNLNLFFSEKENILFYVPGYRTHTNIHEHITSLHKDFNEFMMFGNFDPSAVQFENEISVSRRYKFMRVLWVKDPVLVSDEAFRISEKWSMWEWLNN